MPLDNTSDISGPLARSVEDVARMLEALAGPDPQDPLTLTNRGLNRTANYTRYLQRDGLKGARVGVLRQVISTDSADPEVMQLFQDALNTMAAQGAPPDFQFVRPPMMRIIRRRVSACNLAPSFHWRLLQLCSALLRVISIVYAQLLFNQSMSHERKGPQETLVSLCPPVLRGARLLCAGATIVEDFRISGNSLGGYDWDGRSGQWWTGSQSAGHWEDINCGAHFKFDLNQYLTTAATRFRAIQVRTDRRH